MSTEMLQGWIMLSNLGVMGLLGSAALIAGMGAMREARASIRARRR